MNNIFDTTILENIIIGRVEPYIYAFSTNTIPNYLKVGDTFRGVNVRIGEWKKYYPDLNKEFESSAMLEDGTKYFRDFSVHQFLESEKKYKRLKENEIKEVTYYSREFFMNATIKDVEEAIIDIKNDYVNSSQKYQFYNVDSRLAEEQIYERNQDYEPRPNQQATIDKFEQAVKNGRNNLLMYAVMRFGKSFTSMCCANKMNAKFVVIVSAKADVKEEWKKTVQSHTLFKDYKFLSVADLNRNDNIIKNVFDGKIEGKTKVAVFLTLQDLQGKNIKNKHKEVFENKIDLLIIDETHFGARAEKYGQVLDDKALSQDNKKAQDDDSVSIEDAEKQIKILDAKIKLHLSGTPYRILMGNEFKEEDIIAFYQFTDIADDQKKWIDDNNDKPEDVQKEDWENPYYGFPQMIRFAFNPNESSRKRLEELKKNGVSYAFSELMKPKSISKSDNNDHKIFVYEKEIKELLEVIDGTREDNELLGFLNYDKIKNGKMCRHIVMVLPYRASCDAMEELIRKTKLPRIGEYEIINISGVENPKLYKKVSDIKSKISELEKENKKTITLTVNRMLTGSIVPEWDTMLYFKDTSSAQEYDQAIFRLQNQYIKTCKTEDEKSEIKINMKPQTLLVDFLPLRMFQMQEKKAQIYNVNTDEGGNNKLKERITKELEISPIIAVNKNKIVQVESSDILEAISGYKMNKGIKDEAFDIPVDLKILDDITIKNVISNENELDSKSGLKIQAYIEDTNIDGDLDITVSNNNDINDDNQNTNMPSNDQNEKESWEKKIQSYYAKILFFAFLTSDKVISLKDILDNLSKADNKRIACNLGLNGKVLKAIYDYYKNDKFILRVLDYKIQDLSNLSHKDLELEEKLNVAMSKFGKLGSSVVITPSNICDDMVNLLPNDAFKNNKRFLDIAGVYGEFAISIVKKYKELNSTGHGFENLIYTIPKNSICYELTRKVYEMLDLNTNNIATFYSEDLLKIKKKTKNKMKIDYNMIKNIICQNKPFSEIKTSDKVEEGVGMCEFNTVLGNPPYQLETENWDSKTNGQARRSNIFHHFQLSADKISGNYEVLIYPGKRWWHRSGKGVEEFGKNQINDPLLENVIMYKDARNVFPNSEIGDGISIVSKNKNKHSKSFKYIYYEENTSRPLITIINNPENNLLPLNPNDTIIVNKISAVINKHSFKYLFDRVLPQKLFNIESGFIENNKNTIKLSKELNSINFDKFIKLFTNDKSGPAGRTKWFVIDKNVIEKDKRKYIEEWQVVVSSAHPGGQEGRSNQIEIIDNHSAFGRSRVALGSFKTEQEAKNFYNYCNTKLIKFMFLMTDEALTSLGKKVPDILDYTDNNKFIDFNSDLDFQLFSLFEISPQEQDYIKRVIDAK